MGADQTAATAKGEVEVDGCYVGGHIRPANHKENRRDRRLAKNQTGKRRVVVVMRERGGRTLPFVVKAEGEEAVLEIDDDGKGLDGRRGSSGGQGLRNMEERAASIGGRFRLESSPGPGSTVRVVLPLSRRPGPRAPGPSHPPGH